MQHGVLRYGARVVAVLQAHEVARRERAVGTKNPICHDGTHRGLGVPNQYGVVDRSRGERLVRSAGHRSAESETKMHVKRGLQERPRESRSACVPVVESADSWERNNPSALDRFYVAAARRSLLQCLVNPVFVIIAPVRAKDAPEMAFAKNDHAVETLAPDGPDDSLCVRILPRALRCGDNFFGTHCPESSSEVFAVDPVTITKQIAWCFVPRKRLGQLPCGPHGTWTRCDGKVDNFTTLVPQYDKAVEELKRYGWNDEEVVGRRFRHVILQEGLPGLRRRPCASYHVFSNGRLSDLVAE